MEKQKQGRLAVVEEQALAIGRWGESGALERGALDRGERLELTERLLVCGAQQRVPDLA